MTHCNLVLLDKQEKERLNEIMRVLWNGLHEDMNLVDYDIFLGCYQNALEDWGKSVRVRMVREIASKS